MNPYICIMIWVACMSFVAAVMPEMYERSGMDYFFTGMTIVIGGTVLWGILMLAAFSLMRLLADTKTRKFSETDE